LLKIKEMSMYSMMKDRTIQLPRRPLGRTGLHVPVLCFGSMLFGEGTSYPEASRLLDSCMGYGINFFDSAEMYPVPQSAETSGLSEQYLGQWLRDSQWKREDVVISTKAAGPSGKMLWIRNGPERIDKRNIKEAIEGSLMRLGTDYIDLYQLHWPDRYVPMFGDLDYDLSCSYLSVPLEEQLSALADAVIEGKIRHVGLSNETAWGLMKCLSLSSSEGSAAEEEGMPRIACLQNAYSLTCRTFEQHLAEICHLEGVSLLAYSPLSMGILTGKYLDPFQSDDPKARLNKYKGRYGEAESRYGPRPNVMRAVRAYCDLAKELGMSPVELAIGFVLSSPLVASAVVGATSLKQLGEIVTAVGRLPLSPQAMERINCIHTEIPNPTP
jgi:aryl-alcohol dehydrogenase-like predicted oxidoreductase